MKPISTYLNLRLRDLAPQFVKKTYRIFRSFGDTKSSPPLPAELLENCRFCASRDHMLEHLPAGGIVAELGTWKGDFARKILQKTSPVELHLVDLDFTNFSSANLTGKQVRTHKGLVHEVINSFEDEKFDWVYVDADHSYEGVRRDANASADKIRPGGYMVFNDFAHIDLKLGRYGVHRAVVEFAIERAWPIRFFAYQGSALYDIALQKPVE